MPAVEALMDRRARLERETGPAQRPALAHRVDPGMQPRTVTAVIVGAGYPRIGVRMLSFSEYTLTPPKPENPAGS